MDPASQPQPAQARGVLLAIEGAIAADVSEQTKQLRSQLEQEGYAVASFDFPTLSQPSGYFVDQYLKNTYGPPDKVGPYAASLFYALDHYHTAHDIQRALDEGKVVLVSRFVAANMAARAEQIQHPEERRGYYIWLDNVEFRMLGVPRPSLTVVLKPTNPDKGPNQQLTAVFAELSALFAQGFTEVNYPSGGDQSALADLTRKIIAPALPPKPATPAHQSPPSPATAVSTQNPAPNLTSNSDQPVYVFTNRVPSEAAAATFVRHSQNDGNIRSILQTAFAEATSNDHALLQKTLAEHDGQSVGLLASQYVVIEQASGLLAQKLASAQQTAYQELPGHLAHYAKKNEQGRYKYHIPPYFDKVAAKAYREVMDKIFDTYAEMLPKLTAHMRDQAVSKDDEQAHTILRAVLPVAASTTTSLYGSVQSLEDLIIHLLSDDLPEAKTVGKQLLHECRAALPDFPQTADAPSQGGAHTAYLANTRTSLQNLVSAHLSATHSEPTSPVQLAQVWPRNELDLVPDMLFEQSDLSLKELETVVNGWPFDRKTEIFQAYIGERLNRRHLPGSALKNVHYTWDITSSYDVFRDMQRLHRGPGIERQELTPRFGYEVPAVIDDAGLTDDYQRCFDLSLALYSHLQQKGYVVEAQYATLWGHNMRWRLTHDALGAFRLHEQKNIVSSPGATTLMSTMQEKLAVTHPMLATAMLFAHKNETAELTRLAAERYARYKHQSSGR